MSKSADQYEFSFTWKITNFSFCVQKHGEFISSPKFAAENLGGSKWALLIYPQGHTTSKNYVSCFLGNVDLVTKNIAVEYKCEIVRKDKTVVKFWEFVHTFKKGDACGLDRFMSFERFHREKQMVAEDYLIYVCHMRRVETAVRGYHITQEAHTQIGVNQFSVLWNVMNLNSSEWTQSKMFPNPDDISFKITLTCPENDVLINIQMVGNNLLPAKFVKCKICLLDKKAIIKNSKHESYLFESKDNVWQFPSFITKNYVQEEENNILKNEIFILLFEFSVSNEKNVVEIEGTTGYTFPKENYFYNVGSISTLQDDFRELFISEKNSDVKLKIGETIFLAHKLVLGTRSPVFSAMFDQNMSENQSGVVYIEDMDACTLKLFLKFMYTDSLDKIDYEFASKLLIAADKYQVNSLKERCIEYLIASISLENVCETLVVSDMVCNNNLKDCAIECISEHSDTILTSSEWCQWIGKNPQLGI